ncbi:MAG: cytochrome b/b6 domain-containing protein [Aliidongia sp.]
MKFIHGKLGWLLAFVLLHAGAALRHHFVLRDGVLRRMLPPRPVPKETRS